MPARERWCLGDLHTREKWNAVFYALFSNQAMNRCVDPVA
jgi:hypothetical protein